MKQKFYLVCVGLLIASDAQAQQVISLTSVETQQVPVAKNCSFETLIDKNLIPSENYDHLLGLRKKSIDSKQNGLYDALLSIIRTLPNKVTDDNNKVLVSSFDELNWLLNKSTNDTVPNKVTHIRKLLGKSLFIHLNFEQMKQCLHIADGIEKVIQISSLNNETGPEDGVDLYNADFFLITERQNAKNIFDNVNALQKQITDYQENILSISIDELKRRIVACNEFVNSLAYKTIKCGEEQIRISRNIRHQLKDIAHQVLSKLINQLNCVENG